MPLRIHSRVSFPLIFRGTTVPAGGTTEISDDTSFILASQLAAARAANYINTVAFANPGAVGTAEIADNAVTSPKILDGGVVTADLADGSVTNPKLGPLAVDAAKLAADAVITVKILDSNITAGKLAADSVTTVKILDANVTAPKIASDAVITAKILDGNVTTGKLADGAVSPIKTAIVDADGLSPTLVIRKAFAAGGGGVADDVLIYSANAPFGFRILNTITYISTVIALSTVTLRSATGGGGTAFTDVLSSAIAGSIPNVLLTGTGTVASGGTLTIRRSDNGVAGEMVIFIQRT